MTTYEYLIGSLILLAIWIGVYLKVGKSSRHEMLWASLIASPLAILEPIFVPAYWNPPTLFDLARNTGFDIESFLFCFAVGGLSTILYEAFFKVKHVRMGNAECAKHRMHGWALAAGPVSFAVLYFATQWNPIYSASAGMLIGALAAIHCRPDLASKVLFSGLTFFALYFVFFLFFLWLYPGYVYGVWNLKELSGILIFGVPLEELVYAITQGMYWSTLYEHFYWLRTVKRR